MCIRDRVSAPDSENNPMFNRVLLHGSETQKPDITKVAAIKLVPRRLSKIIPEALESVSKIVWLIF